MTKMQLTDKSRMSVALNAAAYMRWIETRSGKPFHAEAVQAAIRGLLDNESISYTVDEIQEIEILALALNVDIVEAYIKESKIFDDFDRAIESVIAS